MFERYDVEKLYLAQEAVLMLYESGITTGVICQSGDDITEAIPVKDGFPIPSAIHKHLNSAGKELTNFLA